MGNDLSLEKSFNCGTSKTTVIETNSKTTAQLREEAESILNGIHEEMTIEAWNGTLHDIAEAMRFRLRF